MGLDLERLCEDQVHLGAEPTCSVLRELLRGYIHLAE